MIPLIQIRIVRAALMRVVTSLLIIAGGFLRPETAVADQTFDCIIEPSLRLKLAAPAAGVLREVSVDRGSLVKKGQVVARLDSDIEEAILALDEARARQGDIMEGRRARIAFLQRKEARLQKLAGANLATPTAIDEVETDLRVAKSDLGEALKTTELAELEVKKQRAVVRQRSIVTPIDGVVEERNLFAGEYTYEQAPIMTIAQIDPLKVEVYLPTASFRSVVVGQEVRVQPETPIGGDYLATIDVVDAVMDPRSGTFGLRLNLPNPGHTLPAGIRCRATIHDAENRPYGPTDRSPKSPLIRNK